MEEDIDIRIALFRDMLEARRRYDPHREMCSALTLYDLGIMVRFTSPARFVVSRLRMRAATHRVQLMHG